MVFREPASRKALNIRPLGYQRWSNQRRDTSYDQVDKKRRPPTGAEHPLRQRQRQKASYQQSRQVEPSAFAGGEDLEG